MGAAVVPASDGALTLTSLVAVTDDLFAGDPKAVVKGLVESVAAALFGAPVPPALVILCGNPPKTTDGPKLFVVAPPAALLCVDPPNIAAGLELLVVPVPGALLSALNVGYPR